MSIVPPSASGVNSLNPVPDAKTALIEKLYKSICTLISSNEIVEIRVMGVDGKNRTDSGYFDDFHKAARVAASYWGRGQITITLNPPMRALLSRSFNRMTEYAKHTTSDKEITRLWWLFIDCDPRRPAGISASDDEHQTALDRATAITTYLAEQGWPEPICADSGNGAHLLYRIDLPNTEENAKLLKAVLAALGTRFTDLKIEIDPGTFNPARLVKLYGTSAQKGDNTPARPHRVSAILSAPTAPQPVSRDQLAALVLAAFPLKSLDELDKSSAPSKRPVAGVSSQNSITDFKDEVLSCFDMVAYAEQRWGVAATIEGDEYRITGHGGLLINPVKGCWRTFRDDVGGGPIELCGYYLHRAAYRSDGPMFWEALREAAGFVGLDADRYLKPIATASRNSGVTDERKRLIPAAEWLNRLPVGWLLNGILPKKAIGFLWGASGIGKSFLTLHLALLIAQTRVVIYIASEGADGYGPRMKAWMAHYKKGVGKLYFRQELLAVDEGEVSAFIQQIVDLRPELIIIDTFSAAMPGISDNDAAEISSLSRNCRCLAQATGATVLGVHHPTKEGSTFRGSGAFLANFDFVMSAEELDGDMRVTCQKMREAESFPQQHLAFLSVDIGLPDQKGRVIVPSDLVMRSKDDPLTHTQRAILNALLDDEMDDGKGRTSSELIAAHCSSESSVYAACNRLKKWGLIDQETKGSPYRLTEEGRTAHQRENSKAAGATELGANNRLFFPSLADEPLDHSNGPCSSVAPNSSDSNLTPGNSKKLDSTPTPDSTPNLSLGEVGGGGGVEQEVIADLELSKERIDDPTLLPLGLSGVEREVLRKLAERTESLSNETSAIIPIYGLFQDDGLVALGLWQALSALQQKGCLVADAGGAGLQITALGYTTLSR